MKPFINYKLLITYFLFSLNLLACGESDKDNEIIDLDDPKITTIQITGDLFFLGADSENVVVSIDSTDGSYICNLNNVTDVTARIPYFIFTSDEANEIPLSWVEIVATDVSGVNFSPSFYITSSTANIQNNGEEGKLSLQLKVTELGEKIRTSNKIKVVFKID
ncbi:MAG: hypothetical protein DWQ06_04410 [Calditrichaeota bacterium]|nr:MAG: hypothetical protein DWQ06_04410 [Calditrichota bacterium]